MEAYGGLGEDVEVAADEGCVEGSACIECAEDGLVFGVDIDHLGFTEICIVKGEDADYVAVGVVFGLHFVSLWKDETDFDRRSKHRTKKDSEEEGDYDLGF